MSSAFLLAGLIVTFFIGYIFGFGAGKASGKIEVLERELDGPGGDGP